MAKFAYRGPVVGQTVKSGSVRAVTAPAQSRSSGGRFGKKGAGLLVGGARGASKGESKRAKAAKIAKFKATRGM